MTNQAEAHYSCPDCGSLDLSIRGEGLKGPDGKSLAKSACPNCGWKGNLSDTVGFVTTDNVWSTERVGEVLLRVASIHAAGPMIQVLEFVGLIPKHLTEAPPPEENHGRSWTAEDLEKHNECAQIIRDRVARSTFEAFITAAFEEAAASHKLYAIEMDLPQHDMLKDEPADPSELGTLRESPRKFGGDVVDINKARKSAPSDD